MMRGRVDTALEGERLLWMVQLQHCHQLTSQVKAERPQLCHVEQKNPEEPPSQTQSATEVEK